MGAVIYRVASIHLVEVGGGRTDGHGPSAECTGRACQFNLSLPKEKACRTELFAHRIWQHSQNGTETTILSEPDVPGRRWLKIPPARIDPVVWFTEGDSVPRSEAAFVVRASSLLCGAAVGVLASSPARKAAAEVTKA
jgi:hypothetical protein